ncbi:hypothetical protein IGI04_017028, partial [Brassica rapa subsp. trilocularis]
LNINKPNTLISFFFDGISSTISHSFSEAILSLASCDAKEPSKLLVLKDMSKNPTDGFNSVIFRFALPLTSFLVHMSSFNGAWSILGGSASAVKQFRLGLLPSFTLLQRLIVDYTIWCWNNVAFKSAREAMRQPKD